MPDLLLELLSEEIPARMQARAAEDLRRLVTDALVAEGLLYEGAVAHVTPRRLALHVAGLPARGQDTREERRGPRVGAPEAALQGFLRSAGLAPAEGLRTVADPKKGEFYVAVIEKAGRPTPEVLAAILPGIVRAFPWPKSMRWGAASAAPGALRWVRPLQSILCTFGSETTGYETVPFAIDGVASGDQSRGHRFMAPATFRAASFAAYEAGLAGARVMLDAGRRRDTIRHEAQGLAFAQGLEVVEDEALLDEVAGLVEWPVVLMGSFEERFLDIPPEVIRATIRANQKCFVLRRADGALAPRFILVSNIEASDGGAAIAAGNERVVRARLSDAKFFWESDLRVPLAERLPKLDAIVFHEKLGTQGERVARIAALARELAPATGADPDLAEQAAHLAKADLVTETVGEFPELQGLVGRRLALAQGADPQVAAALEDHYRPLGPSDRVPSEPVSVAVALADKLDTLVGFWAIGETPTGSKDPFALRRAALGVIRLVLENGLRLPLDVAVSSVLASGLRSAVSPDAGIFSTFSAHLDREGYGVTGSRIGEASLYADVLSGGMAAGWARIESRDDEASFFDGQRLLQLDGFVRPLTSNLLAFFHDRLKIYLRDRGARHDLIDAVLGATADPPHAKVPTAGRPRSTRDAGASFEAPLRGAPQDEGSGGVAVVKDDLLLVVRRVEALGRFLETPDGRNLLAGAKRAANILRIEEKKDGRAYDEPPDPSAFAEPEEGALADALARAGREAGAALAAEDDEGAMRALAGLRPAVDAFFDKVTVNAPDPGLRANRLRLLAALRRASRAVADLSAIAG